ncbi:hypothetical protein TNCV_2542431 [Trichonephila clavipes]|nr:hypothetical protein TNCV_2542431 [Trichonephila clavipes]
MNAVDILHHEVPPTWAWVEPATLGVQDLDQGRSYRRINDTGALSYRGPNMGNYSLTNRASISKKEPRRNFDSRPPHRAFRTYASDSDPLQSFTGVKI